MTGLSIHTAKLNLNPNSSRNFTRLAPQEGAAEERAAEERALKERGLEEGASKQHFLPSSRNLDSAISPHNRPSFRVTPGNKITQVFHHIDCKPVHLQERRRAYPGCIQRRRVAGSVSSHAMVRASCVWEKLVLRWES
jgi:hypothetical protein